MMAKTPEEIRARREARGAADPLNRLRAHNESAIAAGAVPVTETRQLIDAREVLELAAYLTRRCTHPDSDILQHSMGRKLERLGRALQAGLPVATSYCPHRGSLEHFQEGAPQLVNLSKDS